MLSYVLWDMALSGAGPGELGTYGTAFAAQVTAHKLRTGHAALSDQWPGDYRLRAGHLRFVPDGVKAQTFWQYKLNATRDGWVESVRPNEPP